MFKDRVDAGRQLAERLAGFEKEKCIIYALPRGGVPVGYEVALRLKKPLEALIVKKIGAPGQEELALGAVAEGDPPKFYFNRELMAYLQIDREDISSTIERKLKEISEIQHLYRNTGALLLDREAIAIVVDDGIATGATMKAAVNLLREIKQRRIVVAVPAGQDSVLDEIRTMVDEVVCLKSVHTMYAVGEFYNDFSQVTHEIVIQMLRNVDQQLKSGKIYS